MKVVLLAHTQLSEEFSSMIPNDFGLNYEPSDSEIIALTAIRNCYSTLKPTEIVSKEEIRYFGKPAKDGEKGSDAERLFRQIVKSHHTSVLEHLSFTFAIEDVSRSLLAQLTRHRIGFSFSVKGQRYVKYGSKDKIGGFEFIVPESIKQSKTAYRIYLWFMKICQIAYDKLRKCGIPQEDARMVLPNAATCAIVMSCNLRSLLDFYSKRKHKSGSQWEISNLAEELKKKIITVDPWTEQFFN